jgi:hypothetical membrane protein
MKKERKNVVIKIASLCGICAVLDLPIILILGEVHPRYDHFKDFASALGATGSPRAGLISTWWIVYGVMLSVFSYGLLRSMRKDRVLSAVGPLLIMIFAVGDYTRGKDAYDCERNRDERSISRPFFHVDLMDA